MWQLVGAVRVSLAVAASVASVVPAYLLVALLSGALTGAFQNDLLAPSLLAALATSVASVLAIGVPLHLVLRTLNRFAGAFFVIPDFSLAVGVVWLLHPLGEDGARAIMLQDVTSGFIASVVAWVFWWIAVGLASIDASA